MFSKRRVNFCGLSSTYASDMIDPINHRSSINKTARNTCSVRYYMVLDIIKLVGKLYRLYRKITIKWFI